MTNDRLIDQLKALSEKYGMMYGDLDVIDHAIEALHRADIVAAHEPSPSHGWKPEAIRDALRILRSAEALDAVCTCGKRMGEHPAQPPWWPCMLKSSENRGGDG